MRDLTQLLIDTVAGDSALSTLLGASSADPRLYRYFQGDATIDETHLAYLAYSEVAFPEQRGGTGDPVHSLQIWAATPETMEAVTDRLHALFHQKTLTTTKGRKVYTKIISSRDSDAEQPNFIGKTLHIRFSWLAVAASSWIGS